MIYTGPINSKLPRVGTTIFSVMSKLAVEHQAINLSQGFPDFDCNEELILLANYYMARGHNQYAPMQGVLKLRELIAQKTFELYGAQYSPDTEITITAGATQAIYTAIAAVVRERDEVIVIEPCYDCYAPAIEANGGKTIFVKLNEDFSLNWDMVKRATSPHTKMIIFNTPNNPTGTVWKSEDLLMLEKIVKNTNIIVLSDEVYEHMVFDNQQHESATKYEGLRDRSFIVGSFGKTIHTTGWKIGYCMAPENLMLEFRKIHQFLVFCVNTPLQWAIADFLSNRDNYLQVSSFYQRKRDYFLQLMKGSRFEALHSEGTYFQLMRYQNISQEKDTDFAISLTKEHKVASIPLSVFYNDNFDQKLLRFCFAKKDETLEKAAAILTKL
jgi:methionine transaminase